MSEKSWAFPAATQHIPRESLEFLFQQQGGMLEGEGLHQLNFKSIYFTVPKLCLTMPLPAWKGFLHIKYHHRKSSPERKSVPNLSESGLKPSGVGPGVNPWCCSSDVPSGLHTRPGFSQHSHKNSVFRLQTAQQHHKKQNNKTSGCPVHWGSYNSGVWCLEFPDPGWNWCHGSLSCSCLCCEWLRGVTKSDHTKKILAFLLCGGQILFPSEVVHEEPTAPSPLPQQNKDTDVHCRLHNHFSCVF